MVVKLDVSGVGMTSQRTRNRLTDRLREQGIVNEAVLQVMASTPRHLFVDEALAHRAYEDTALPIGNSQTISQPYIVARMTELLLQDCAANVGFRGWHRFGLSDRHLWRSWWIKFSRLSGYRHCWIALLGRFRQLGIASNQE